MYLSITPQTLGANYSQSSADFVAYLEKENLDLTDTTLPNGDSNLEYFFSQHEDKVSANEVIKAIDTNTAKLKKTEPKFYSITVSPSKYELRKLEHTSEDLKRYTRELMKEYAASFHREINGRPIHVDDIKYFAKIEHQRRFKGTDWQIKENQPYASKILDLKTELRQIEEGRRDGDLKAVKRKITDLEGQAPHQQNGKRIVQGMLKAGDQSHIHIIVSRKDASNSYSLSPGSKYKASVVEMHGKQIKRGFDRDRFYERAEKTFDRLFAYQRNYVETYKAKKEFVHHPKLYFASLMKLPSNEKAMAFKLMRERGVPMLPNIPVSQAQLALRVFKRLRRGAEIAIKSSSIGI
ncbi:MobB family relaxase [Psychroflexus montanilacus]|uniref:MobB family relaxase n=1 Tax=Psychroflexus montanilacus TaxID=2873598 RepID=UPI001CCD591D|nr:MobB family relaxase [Psychroflexus montanilacus]MBZ9650899.1 DUF5712 family protein [Psychroflexus montanilacus]